MSVHEYRITPQDDGQRLDAVLSRLFPTWGIRGRRRLFDNARVLIDGRPSRPGSVVRHGQLICVVLPDESMFDGVRLERSEKPELHVDGAMDPNTGGMNHVPLSLLKVQGEYAFFFKPSGLHSAHLDGALADSAEERIARSFKHIFGGNAPVLCNRLDEPTSGLLVCGAGEDAARRFHALEKAGSVEKLYVAMVRGEVPQAFDVRNSINMSGGTLVRVLDNADPDHNRHTHIECAGFWKNLVISGFAFGPCSLLEVRIRRGARHQIRAHLAHVGHPIVGDMQYGREAAGMPFPFLCLHHAEIHLSGLLCAVMPPWPFWGALARESHLKWSVEK